MLYILLPGLRDIAPLLELLPSSFGLVDILGFPREGRITCPYPGDSSPLGGILWGTFYKKVQRSSAFWISNFMEDKGPARWPDLSRSHSDSWELGGRVSCGLWGRASLCFQGGLRPLVPSVETAALFTPCPLGGACEKGPQSSTKSNEQWSSRETFFESKGPFGKLNLQVTQCEVVESAWTMIKTAGLCPGFTGTICMALRKSVLSRELRLSIRWNCSKVF